MRGPTASQKAREICDKSRAGTNGAACLGEHMIHFDQQQLNVSRSNTILAPHFVCGRLNMVPDDDRMR